MTAAESHLGGRVTLFHGDSRAVLRELPDASIDSVVTDPPYALVSIVKRFGSPTAAASADGDVYARASTGFMGKTWDTGETAFAVEFWAEVMRVLKPGGHVIAASGTRTYHRLAVAIEDAGFEIRDMVSWLYGSGFPKSHDVSKGIDKAAGAVRPVIGRETLSNDIRGGALLDSAHSGDRPSFERDVTAAATADAVRWEGWGTALKPACEPWVLARKPLAGTVAANVLAHGTGAINIDGCRVPTDETIVATRNVALGSSGSGVFGGVNTLGGAGGRWPANVIHDGSEDVVAAFPFAQGQGGAVTGDEPSTPFANVYSAMPRNRAGAAVPRGDAGSAARFFYSAKADALDRAGSKHPTVKPVDLMQYFCRLVTPSAGVVLDPFAGSGSTGEAAWREGFRAVLIEREDEYVADIRERLRLAECGDGTKRRAIAAKKAPAGNGPLFDGVTA